MISLSVYKNNEYYRSKKTGLEFRVLKSGELDLIYSKLDSVKGDNALMFILDRQAARRVVETSCKEQLYNLSTSDVDDLYKEYVKIEKYCTPNVDLLRARLQLAIAGEEDGALDVVAAYKCNTPYEFYGKPVTELTNGQIIYYIVANSVGVEYYESETSKCINLEILKTKIAKLGQSEDINPIDVI